MELERATARERSNTERVSELEARIAAAGAELEQTRTQMAGIEEERAQQRSFLETAAGEAHEFRHKVEARQHEARAAAEEVLRAERELETRPPPRHAPAHARRQRAQLHCARRRKPGSAGARSGAACEAEMGQARNEQENLGVESAESRLRFDGGGGDGRSGWSSEIAALREALQSKRSEENARRARSQPIAQRTGFDRAGGAIRCNALIRNHGYATDTVRRLLKPGALGPSVAPVGTLADFVEVSGEHEGLVDEFLREELNYVVVESWGAAEEGVRVLKTSDGRATFLIHSDAQGELFETGEGAVNEPGVTPLRDAIKVLNGFGRSLEAVLPKLRHGYLAENAIEAQRLASALRARILPDAGRRVLPSLHGDGRQAGQRGPAGAEARVARDRGPAGQAGIRAGAGRRRSGSADSRDRRIDGANWRRAAKSGGRPKAKRPTWARH